MKKLSRLLALLLCISLCLGACSTPPVDENNDGEEENEEDEITSLDGKKVIFLGNSFIFYGHTVIEKSTTTFNLWDRDRDQGYFYQICKANGMEPNVVNWTFGGHSLHDLFSGSCAANRGCDGVDHFSYLTDLVYDYVFISHGAGGKYTKTFDESINRVIEIFRGANPDVKIIFAPSSYTYQANNCQGATDIIDKYDELRAKGIIIADWGRLVHDVIHGYTEVPGAVETYDKNTFIVARTEDDGYHPNQLTGYLTALMAYCVMTGDTAVGQTYAFCNDKTIHKKFDFFTFNAAKYKVSYSNYIRVFESEADMKGLQMLVDQYIEK